MGWPGHSSAASEADSATAAGDPTDHVIPLEVVLDASRRVGRSAGMSEAEDPTIDALSSAQVSVDPDEAIKVSRAVVGALADMDAAVEWFVYKRRAVPGSIGALTLNEVRSILLHVVARPDLIRNPSELYAGDLR